MRTRAFAAAATLATGATFGLAGPAAAAPPQQSGLVNVNVTDLTVQVPVGVAANICDVNVAVLVGTLLADDAADCDADVENGLEVTQGPDNGPTQQEGLVNVNLEDIAVQIPVGVAANICDVNVAVLVSNIADDADTCEAAADNTATITPA
jgi:hypothetical protein